MDVWPSVDAPGLAAATARLVEAGFSAGWAETVSRMVIEAYLSEPPWSETASGSTSRKDGSDDV